MKNNVKPTSKSLNANNNNANNNNANNNNANASPNPSPNASTNTAVKLPENLTLNSKEKYILDSVLNREKIIIIYKDAKGTTTMRMITVKKVNVANEKVLLLSWDYIKDDFRVFRLDRISEVVGVAKV